MSSLFSEEIQDILTNRLFIGLKGVFGSTSIREEKRAKFEAKGKGNGRRSGWVAGIVVIALLAAGALGYRTFFRSEEGIAGNDPVKGPSSTGGGTIAMTDLTAPAATDGRIVLSAATIKEKRMVWFTYGEKKTPVLAYVAPSGKFVTAISMCEPCRSERFHIEGGELVCNACGTRWTLEDLKGISGGCPEYPPERLDNQITGDSVTIDEKAVLEWKPRV